MTSLQKEKAALQRKADLHQGMRSHEAAARGEISMVAQEAATKHLMRILQLWRGGCYEGGRRRLQGGGWGLGTW